MKYWVVSWTSASNSNVFNSTDLAVVVPNSTVNRYLFYTTALWKSYQRLITPSF